MSDSCFQFPVPKNDCVGLILAGGQGSRLGGVRKHDLIIGGQKLSHRAFEALSPICASVYFSAGDKIDHPQADTIFDSGHGPAEAFSEAVRSIRKNSPSAKFLLCTSVDSWAATPKHFARLLNEFDESDVDVAFACDDDRTYFTQLACHLVSMDKLLSVRADTKGDKGRSFKGLFANATTKNVRLDGEFKPNPLRNINHVRDLIAAQATMRASQN